MNLPEHMVEAIVAGGGEFGPVAKKATEPRSTILPINVWIPGMVIVSEPNTRCHWAKKARRVKEQREIVGNHLYGRLRPHKVVPLKVTLYRFYTKRMKPFDDDNLTSGFKASRDAVAKWLGRDDGKAGNVEWRCEQTRSEVAGVQIVIELREPS